MKKLFFLACMMLSVMLAFAQGTKRVAILEVVDKEDKLSYSEKLMLRSNLARAVTNTEGYEAYNRSDMDAIVKEHDFQRSGNVSDVEIKKIGEMTGAAYILVAEGVLSRDGKIYVTAQIINVESGLVEVTDNALMGATSNDMLRGCRALASKMFGAMAGASTSTNKFMQLFKGKQKSAAEQRADSIAAAQKAEQAAAVAAAKEQQRLEEQRIRQERADAEAKARREREEAEAAVREQKKLEQDRKKAEEAERAKYYLTKIDNKHYEYLGTTLDKKAYEKFLQDNCTKAYLEYKKGKKLVEAGWGLFSVGLALSAGGAALMIVGMPPTNPTYEYAPVRKLPVSYSNQEILYISGIVGVSVGGAMTLASIPLLGAGYSKSHKAYKVYNKECASPSIRPLSLNLTAGQNGLGLALNF